MKENYHWEIQSFFFLIRGKTDGEYVVKSGFHLWFWFWFYGISTIVGYLMPNPLYTYILSIYDLVWLGFMAYQPL